MDNYDRVDLETLVKKYGLRQVLEALSWIVDDTVGKE